MGVDRSCGVRSSLLSFGRPAAGARAAPGAGGRMKRGPCSLHSPLLPSSWLGCGFGDLCDSSAYLSHC